MPSSVVLCPSPPASASSVNRSTFVNKKAREQFEVSTYKRLVDIYSSNSKTIDALMKLELPCGVEVEIKV